MFSNGGGPWRTPQYLREIMDSASTRWVRRVSFVGPTQIGKSEAANNIAGWFIHQNPCPLMLVVPRNVDARMASRKRIRPMVMATPVLAEELTESKHDLSAREITFRRSVLYLRSAQSPADLASVPVRVVFGDETEKWPTWSGKEASPLALVTERTRIFHDSLVFLTSTPRRSGGVIVTEFAKGDRRRFHVQCPSCSTWQFFIWSQVRWSEAVETAAQMNEPSLAWYECRQCRHRIDDAAKRTIMASGQWVPEGKDPVEWLATGRLADRSPHRSYHLWAAYSPFLAWWQIVAKYLEARGKPEDMMNFTNSWLAEVWEEQVQSTTDAAVDACLEPRAAGVVPDEVLVVTAAVDVQKDRVEWMVQGWGLDEESWVLDAGRIARMADGGDWRALTDVLFRRVWGKLRVRAVFVDTRGGRGDEVLDWARKHQPEVRMIAGVDRSTPELFGVKKIDRHPRTGQPLQASMQLHTVNVGWFKDLVAGRLQKAIEDPESRAGRIHLPQGLPENWILQISAEHKVRVRSGTREVERWVKKPGRDRNEAWDLLIYNAACARQQFVNLLVSDGNRPFRQQNRKPPPPPRPRRPRPPGGGFPLLGGR